jgi:predicted nucleotidyltransferase
VDYIRPVEALIPGAQGKILAACLRTEQPMTMRGLARLAKVSPNQAKNVIDHLDELGLIHRQRAGRALMVSLNADSPVVDALRIVADLRESTLRRWRDSARQLSPLPLTLSVYGSWARGEAGPGSDIDVLAVLPANLRSEAEDEYREAMAGWCAYAGRVAGLPVSPLILDAQEAAQVDIEARLWVDIRRDAVLIVGDNPREVLHAA